jgi:murein DD-endopeptidase MepM/ murein hydrolase activator NlpD
MVRLEKFDRKLRVITALDLPDNQQGGRLGLGGSHQNFENEGSPESPNSSLINSIHGDLKNLRARSELQEISFLELDEFFKNQSSLFSSTPSIWPARGWVTSTFGYRRSPFTGQRELHEGVDVATRVGSPVVATANGVVIRAGIDNSYGKMIEIDHGYGVLTRYGHNSVHFVKAGDQVKRGQVIAEVGNTGRSTGPHSHYEVILNGVPVNPLRYILEEGTGEF